MVSIVWHISLIALVRRRPSPVEKCSMKADICFVPLTPIAFLYGESTKKRKKWLANDNAKIAKSPKLKSSVKPPSHKKYKLVIGDNRDTGKAILAGALP